jgi:hypothetical protein
MDINLLDLTEQLRAIGRGVVLIHSPYDGGAWDFATEIELEHLGDTEGDIEPAVEEEYSELTLPELTGPRAHERYLDGETVALTIPLYFADPDLRRVVSPTGSASAGNQRQRKVREYTLCVMPEQLFLDDEGNRVTVAFSAGSWTKGGQALTAHEIELLGMSLWFWRGSFTRALPSFSHADGGKSVTPVEFSIMHASLAPEGHHAWTVGDPADAEIDLEGGS